MPDNNYTDYLTTVAGLNFTLPTPVGANSLALKADGTFKDFGTSNFPPVTPFQAGDIIVPGSALANLDAYWDTAIGAIFTGANPNGRDTFENFITALGITDTPTRNDVFNRFYYEFLYLNGIPQDPNSQGLGAWEDLVDFSGNASYATSLNLGKNNQPLLDSQNQAITDRTSLAKDLFTKTMDYFLQHYTWPLTLERSSNINRFLQFVADYERFLIARTTVQDSSVAQYSGANFTDFKKLYDEFVTNGSDEDYKERLIAFARRMIERDSYFNPNHHLADWFQEVQVAALINSGGVLSVAGTESSRSRILVRIFLLLVEMIEALQRVTAAQSDRLKFYAQYQKAYTELLGKMPTVTLGNLMIEGDDQKKASVLQSVQAWTGSWSETLRSYRSVIGDESKQHQTSVNQSNEIVNQQAQLGTSILQQLSTMLTTIFK